MISSPSLDSSTPSPTNSSSTKTSPLDLSPTAHLPPLAPANKVATGNNVFKNQSIINQLESIPKIENVDDDVILEGFDEEMNKQDDEGIFSSRSEKSPFLSNSLKIEYDPKKNLISRSSDQFDPNYRDRTQTEMPILKSYPSFLETPPISRKKNALFKSISANKAISKENVNNNIADQLVEQAYIPSLTAQTTDLSTLKIAEKGRLMATKNTRRLVFKDGTCNVTTGNVMEKRKKYLVDIFTTLVDMKWRYNFLMFVSGFVASWLFFAVCWFIVTVAHQDHENRDDPNWRPCLANVYDFRTAFLFSVETQQTIGYGFRGAEPNCPHVVIILMIQCCVGVFIQSLTAGIIFAKLSQPKRRAHTLLFSRKAVICNRDGEYCLLFRVGNMRKSHFVGTSIRAFIVKDKYTKEGECIPLCQNPLDIQPETCNDDDFVFLAWPVTVIHRINKDSPFWELSLEKLQEEHFEIIVILEGIVESTGMTTQVRTSYLPREVLWGHRLAPLITYQKENGQYKIDYSQFHAVIPILSMPDCSAQTYFQKKKTYDEGSTLKITEMEEHNFGYISPDSNGPKPDSLRITMLKKMRGSVKLRSVKTNSNSRKKDLGLPAPNLHRRMSASTSALRALKDEAFARSSNDGSSGQIF